MNVILFYQLMPVFHIALTVLGILAGIKIGYWRAHAKNARAIVFYSEIINLLDGGKSR